MTLTLFTPLPWRRALKLYLTIPLLIIASASNAYGALVAGDIAIIGYHGDHVSSVASTTDDGFAWVPLVDIDGGTEIFFADDGWKSNNTWRGEEGLIKYTAPVGGLTAGTTMVLHFVRDTHAPPSYTFTPEGGGGTYVGDNNALVVDLGMLISNAGDNLFVFTGSAAAPNFIYGLKTNGGAFDADATANKRTALPSSLTVGTTAIALGPGESDTPDNGRYIGTTTGTRESLLTSISDPNNWELSSSLPFSGGSEDIANGTVDSGGFTVNSSGGGGAPIPEPATVAIWTVLALGLVRVHRRRRR